MATAINQLLPRRRPSPNTLDALHELADAPANAMPRQMLLLRLHEKGLDSQFANRAIAALERRAWITIINEAVRLTEAGQVAASGEGIKPHKKAKRSMNGRAKSTRMPRGLF
jgi:hypothetical protein